MELKPCPFCGSEAEEYEPDIGPKVIVCTGCGIEGPDMDQKDHIEAWNTRLNCEEQGG
jgi:Lar family restriction alleviation protein